MKKVFALLVCAVMLLSFTACLAAPESEEVAKEKNDSKHVTDKLSEKDDNGELPVSGVEGAYKFDEYSDHIVLTQYIGTEPGVFVPDEINGKPVTEFGTIFRGNLNIKTVVLGKHCTEIADVAFENCYSIKKLEIVDSVKSIGKCAFLGCQSLEVIIIPGCVEKIADDAFLYITKLQVCGDKGSAAERLAETYESIYFTDITELSENESTNALIGETYSEDIL